MSSDAAIRAEGLGKRYRVGVSGTSYGRLTESLSNAVRASFSRRKAAAAPERHIWALRDVSFEIGRGEVVGIVGRNGAGKTTLLKLLSRITAPTEGQATLRGRVGALLEVGTGFHPELTGRENIFLNGAILGMRRESIKARFDEIVEFAEVERFIDTPVKRYSSGMYVRLAFAVAAHLEPEVLVVDEVLAVGDAGFQKKCLGKMSDVAGDGRTVIFVTHNMGAVRRLCQRAIMLEHGSITQDGDVEPVVRAYLSAAIPPAELSEIAVSDDPDLTFAVRRIRLEGPEGAPAVTVGLWEELKVRIDYVIRRPLVGANLALSVGREGTTIFNSFDTDVSPERFEHREPGEYQATIALPAGLLAMGTYSISVSTGQMTSAGQIQNLPDVLSFDVIAFGEDLGHKSYSRSAVVIAQLEWETVRRAGSV